MGRARRNRYSAEFKAEAVRLVRASSDPLAKVARDVGVNPETLRLWVQAALPGTSAVTDEERGELKRLRREVRELRMERDILKKATAFFAKQSE
jgi:transposase